LLAATSNESPRYFWIVFAFAGDSTMTKLFFFFGIVFAFAGDSTMSKLFFFFGGTKLTPDFLLQFQ
jgi:hypothetical protein